MLGFLLLYGRFLSKQPYLFLGEIMVLVDKGNIMM